MLDLLIAADAAANTPERRQLLDGLLDENDREVARALESGVCHSELLGQDFFWCFMGLAGLHGDRSVWRVLGDYGYSFATEIIPPLEEESASSSPGRPMSLASWLAQFAPLERLKELEESHAIDPWAPDFKVGSGLNWNWLSPGEVGMIAGTSAHFDHWLDRWDRREQAQVKAQELFRGQSPDRVSVPIALRMIVGMQRLHETPTAEPSSSLGPRPAVEELTRRGEALIQTWLRIHYPAENETARWAALNCAPPFEWKENVQEALKWIARWQAAQTPEPFASPVEETALTDKNWYWVRALLAAGVPLSRPNHAFAMGLPHALAVGHACDAEEGNGCPEAAQAFVERARQECPIALDAFFSAPMRLEPSLSAQPPIFWALAIDNQGAVGRLLKWGQPLDVKIGKGVSLGKALVEKAVAEGSSPQQAHRCLSLLEWLKRASVDQKNALWAADPSQVSRTGGKREEFPERVLLKQERTHGLVLLLEHGVPLGRPGELPLGHAILKLGEATNFWDRDLWVAFAQRALHEGHSCVPKRLLKQEPDQWAQAFVNNPARAWAEINREWMEEQVAESPGVSRARPRI